MKRPINQIDMSKTRNAIGSKRIVSFARTGSPPTFFVDSSLQYIYEFLFAVVALPSFCFICKSGLIYDTLLYVPSLSWLKLICVPSA